MVIPVFEAIDIVALLGVFILIGLLMAVGYTFHTFAQSIDIHILGLRPFHGLANSIEATIVRSCNEGIEKLGHLAHDLWHGITWSTSQILQGIMAVADAAHDAFKFVKEHTINDVINPALDVIKTGIGAVSSELDDFKKAINKDVTALKSTVDGLPDSIVKTADSHAGGLVDTLRNDVGKMLTTLRGDIAKDISTAESAAETAGDTAVSKLRTDVATNLSNAITNVHTDVSTAAGILEGEIGGLGTDLGATAESLRDFIGKVPLADIAAVIAAVPILATVVSTLESETGLNKKECRRKVSSLCTTDEGLFNVLMSGLTLVGLGIGLEEIINAIIGLAEAISGPLEDFVRG